MIVVRLLPAMAMESVQDPAVVEAAMPVKVWKSSLSWQISSWTLLTVNTHDPVVVGVYVLGYLRNGHLESFLLQITKQTLRF